MSVEIAWKQNILVTDFHLLKSLLVFFDLVRRHSSVDSADKTLTVYQEKVSYEKKSGETSKLVYMYNT